MCYSALVKQDLEHLGRQLGAIVVREQFADYRRASAEDPKRFPPLQDRIYPGHYAPVAYAGLAAREVRPMRYGAYSPESVGTAKKYTTFNARRDNLTSPFWSEAFMRHHGVVVLEGFYEWVAVADLLEAGTVKLADVKAEFIRQAEERRTRMLAAGKAYRPTPTELKNPLERQIIIEFRPEDGTELLAPVIFSKTRLGNGREDAGFAIITDEPPAEVLAAGHDRCPVVLENGAIEEWLRFGKKTARELDQLLTKRRRVTFRHKLAEAA